jgi:hypothetical protein
MFKKPVIEASVDTTAIEEAIAALPTASDIEALQGDVTDIKSDVATIKINTTPTP